MYVYSSSFGADDAIPAGTPSACLPCYQQKSVAYPECQRLPAGSTEREACFKKADGDLLSCLQACGWTSKQSSLPLLLTVALVAGAVWSG